MVRDRSVRVAVFRCSPEPADDERLHEEDQG